MHCIFWFLIIIGIVIALYFIIKCCTSNTQIIGTAKSQHRIESPLLEKAITLWKRNGKDLQKEVAASTNISTLLSQQESESELSQFCGKAVIISMDKSKDRLDEMVPEINKYFAGELLVQRFHAIARPKNGALGCLLSHAAALSHNEGKNILVLEDDFEFTVSKKKLLENLRAVKNTLGDRWDVIVFGQYCKDWGPIGTGDQVKRLYHNTTTSGYLVNKNYVSVLRDLWFDLIARVGHKPRLKGCENCDQEQTKLQEKDIWIGFSQSLGRQKITKSTIWNGVNNNQWKALGDQFQGWAGKKYPLRTRPRQQVKLIGVIVDKPAKLGLLEKIYQNYRKGNILVFISTSKIPNLNFPEIVGVDVADLQGKMELVYLSELV